MLLETIDCEYLNPKFAAAYLLISGREAAFIETNTAHAVPKMLQALKNHELDPEQVRYIIITHVHLDHSAGASALVRSCPRATLVAHPRAAKHLIDPTRLVQSARKVYGDEAFERLYGDIQPIPSDRVKIVEDGEKLPFGSGELSFLHTRGHANHHMAIHVPALSGIFTGDAFGLAYPALQNQGLVILPTTSPTEFDPEEAKRSVDRIIATGAKRAFLTHFGEIRDLETAGTQLRQHIEFSGNLMIRAMESGTQGQALSQFCERELRGYFVSYLESRNIQFTPEKWELLRLDLELNAAGIDAAAERRTKEH